MYSGQDQAQRESSNSQNPTSNVHLIEVMEMKDKPASKSSSDDLGNYQGLAAEDNMGSNHAQPEGGTNSKGPTSDAGDAKGTGATTDATVTKGTGGTTGATDTKGTGGQAKEDVEAQEKKSDKCCNCCCNCSWTCWKLNVWWIITIVGLGIAALVFFAFMVNSYSKSRCVSEKITPSTTTTSAPATPPPVPMVSLQGLVTTADSYIADYSNSSTEAYMAYVNIFRSEVMSFYTQNRNYIAYYKDTIVTDLEEDQTHGKVLVNFEILFSKLDNDNLGPPDAHSVLLQWIENNRTIGDIRIVGSPHLTKGDAN